MEREVKRDLRFHSKEWGDGCDNYDEKLGCVCCPLNLLETSAKLPLAPDMYLSE